MSSPEMIKEHPILFSPAMVRAQLKGIKTMTRRVIGPKNSLVNGKHVTPKKWNECYFNFSQAEVIDDFHLLVPSKIHNGKWTIFPLYQHGDLLWVREAYFKAPVITEQMLKDGADSWEKYYYAADSSEQETEQLKEWEWQLKSCIHMPKDAARIWNEVVRCYPERIQKISEADALQEGMTIGCMINNDARITFNQLWNQMHPGSWRDNDFVWVTEFKILSTNGKPLFKKLMNVEL